MGYEETMSLNGNAAKEPGIGMVYQKALSILMMCLKKMCIWKYKILYASKKQSR